MGRILFLLVVSIISWLSLTEYVSAAVGITLPNGGECLTVGQAYTIEVTYDDDHVALYYRTDGEQPTHLDSSLIKHPLKKTAWDWTPGSGDISETGRIWAQGHLVNHESTGAWDDSDANFSVRASCAPPAPTGGGGGGEFLVPTTIQTLTISKITTSSAVIDWRTDRYSYYKFSYGKSSGEYDEDFSTGPPHSDRADNTVTLRGLSGDTTYYFKITTGLYQLETKESEEYSFKTLDTIPPAPVSNIFGIAGASTILTSWLNPVDPDFKETVIVRRDDRLAEHKTDGEIVFIGADIYYADAGLTNGINYYYSIFTVDFNENVSKPVNILLVPQADLEDVSTPPEVDSSPATTTMRVSSLSSKTEEDAVFLKWSNPKNPHFLGIQIVRNRSSLPANPYDGDVVFRGRAESFRDSELSPEQRYNYGLFAFDWENNFYQSAFISDITKPPKEALQKLKSQIEEAGRLIEELRLALKVKIIVRKPTKVLGFGSRGEEVKTLQELLAKHPNLYPEGLITGYFGSLTRRAVQRFQESYNIVSSGNENTTGYGSVGPKTREGLDLLAFRAIPEKVDLKEEPAKKIYSVSALPEGFSPKFITVPLGATVSWLNKRSQPFWPASAVHPTHQFYPGSHIAKCGTEETEGIFDACGEIDPSGEWSFTFKEAGTWVYHDHLDPVETGVVIVE